MDEPYAMIEYIRESPQALEATLKANRMGLQSLAQAVRQRELQRVVIAGLGSSYTAAMMAGPIFAFHCPLKTLILPATEVRHYAPRWVDERTLVVVISRSGERGPVVDTLTEALDRGAYGVAITGVADSLLAQNSRLTLITSEGRESAFPKTKSVSAGAGLLMALGLSLADPTDEAARERLQALMILPASIEATIDAAEGPVRDFVSGLEKVELAAVTGSASNYGVALEAAVKIQEAASIFTRGDTPAGLLHGPIGALNERCLVVSLITPADWEDSQQTLRLARATGARCLCVYSPALEMGGECERALQVAGAVDPFTAGLLYLPVIQLLTYAWAVGRGLNPDTPEATGSILEAILPPGREEP